MITLPDWAYAYLKRLGLEPQPADLPFLEDLCRAHVQTFPYENVSKLLFFQSHGRSFVPSLVLGSLWPRGRTHRARSRPCRPLPLSACGGRSWSATVDILIRMRRGSCPMRELPDFSPSIERSFLPDAPFMTACSFSGTNWIGSEASL